MVEFIIVKIDIDFTLIIVGILIYVKWN